MKTYDFHFVTTETRSIAIEAADKEEALEKLRAIMKDDPIGESELLEIDTAPPHYVEVHTKGGPATSYYNISSLGVWY